MILRLLIALTTFLASEPVQRPLSPLTYFGACMTGPGVTYNCPCIWGWTIFGGSCIDHQPPILVPCCIRLDSGVHQAVCRLEVVRTCDGLDIDGDGDIDLLDYAWLMRAQVALETTE